MNSGAYANHCVLVVDDQESIVSLVERVVSTRLGCQVLEARNGDEALEQLASAPVDVMITDMMMPGLHGLDLLRKAKDGWPDIHIIVMTGYSADFPYVEIIEAGAHDFMNKPFPIGELEAKLIRIFQERSLRRAREVSEQKYRNLFELSSDGMLLLDSSPYTIADANQAFRMLSGRTLDGLKGTLVFELFEEGDRMRLEHWLSICAQRGGGTITDLVFSHANGQKIHVDVSASFIEVANARIVFFLLKDVTEKREVEKQLDDAAQRDQLTGLFNRRSFQHRIEWALTRARDRKIPLSLLMIDLDNFKQCNDTYGHATGDQLLISVGRVMKESVRQGDECYRFGGDEFAVILNDADREEAVEVAERMRRTFDTIERYGSTLSIGVATCDGNVPADRFIKRADKALYRAKAAGKNGIEAIELEDSGQ